MRYCVFSDSHGHADAMLQAIEREQPEVWMLVNNSGCGYLGNVGEGELDLPSILSACGSSGTKWLVVEQDSPSWNGMNEMECAARSAANLKKYIN